MVEMVVLVEVLVLIMERVFQVKAKAIVVVTLPIIQAIMMVVAVEVVLLVLAP
tara:strand:- start:325 stop:483 length:159 start_codon:yes stop_codon:yes gene_type:complete